MTIEEITHTLRAVSENQARHSADIAEIDKMLVTLVQSQNRYEAMLSRCDDVLRELADRQLKNEERFAETDKRFAQLAAAQLRYETRREQLEASFQLIEQFIRDSRNEANEHRVSTDRLFAETDKKLMALAEAQTRTDEQMKRTDELFRLSLERNGSKAKPEAKAKKGKKTGKKGSAK
jgi:succinate dehydrogenase flavin-adding protein (antitoxin of CptAB toxin-antitoxin module)